MDSLVYALPVNDSDTIPKIWYSELLDILDEKKDSTRYRKILDRALLEASGKPDSLGLGIMQRYMGQFYRLHNVYDSAYYFYNSSFKLLSRLNNLKEAAISRYGMAINFYYSDDYLNSEVTASEALALLENQVDYGLDAYRMRANNLIALSAMAQKADERALEYFEKTLEYFDPSDQKSSTFLILMNNIGTAKHNLGKYDEARVYFRKVLENDSILIKRPADYARSLINLARANFEEGIMEEVESDYLKALKIREEIDDRRGLPRSHYFLAEYYLSQGDSINAKKHIETGKKIAIESSELDGLKDILRLQTRIQPENAVALAFELDSLQESMIQEERSIREKFGRIAYETDQYIAENRLLAQQRLLWIGIALGVVLLGASFLIIIYQRIRNQKLKFQQQQQEANQEIFNLMLGQNEKIEAGKHAVQKRISEDLHDGVLGEMNGIRMVLLGLNGKTDEASQQMRAQAIEKLKGVQEEIRGISHQLNDAAYQKFHNFIVSLEELINGVSEAAGLGYRFKYDGETDWDGLQGEVKINLYRIIQECLQNTVKHARASEVQVEMVSEPDQLRVCIRDNGVGFQTGRGKKGIGQKNIASRIKKLGGRWETKSAPGQGTEVCLWIPCPHGALGYEAGKETGIARVHAAENREAS